MGPKDAAGSGHPCCDTVKQALGSPRAVLLAWRADSVCTTPAMLARVAVHRPACLREKNATARKPRIWSTIGLGLGAWRVFKGCFSKGNH